MTTHIPPRPRTAPTAGRLTPPPAGSRTRNGGTFSPAANVNFTKNTTTVINGNTSTTPGTGSGGKVPGSDFMSNDDIRAFCEYLRKQARNLATERSMDADHLEAVLRTIPDLADSLTGSRARARRVSRWLKKIAAAEKSIQKYAAALYGTFEREYDSELRQIGKGRNQTKPSRNFGWR
ncbi:plasmid transfer protein TraA [Streptomyces sp. NPDC047097]|uniref:plasmid transfer protein TraA n=1 Tax=Streptomyces sp. NPDC047097 TaxID=3155260 RepID=UPI0033FFAE7D